MDDQGLRRRRLSNEKDGFDNCRSFATFGRNGMVFSGNRRHPWKLHDGTKFLNGRGHVCGHRGSRRAPILSTEPDSQ